MKKFAYVFARFPSFTQTFCLREVMEMDRQGVLPMIFSIRSAEEETKLAIPQELAARIQLLPEPLELKAAVLRMRHQKQVAPKIWKQIDDWGTKTDKARLFEAVWIGLRLQEAGITHVHTHFAGIAARTVYWIKRFFGIGFSFTAHANDIFCYTATTVALRELIREARFVATVSNFSRNWLAQEFPRFAGKFHVVYNGIDIDRFAIAGRKEGCTKILSVGRYIEKKGFSDLIEACRLLKEQGCQFECRIVGEGPLEENLKEQIQTAGLAKEVFLTGPRTEAQVIEELAQAQLFVLPCVKETGGGMDNLPTVIMEAMAAGLPVVSTPVAGVPEMVVQGESGKLVPEKAPQQLAQTIKEFLDNPLLAKQMGERGSVLAAERFASPVTAKKLLYLIVSYNRRSFIQSLATLGEQILEKIGAALRVLCKPFGSGRSRAGAGEL